MKSKSLPLTIALLIAFALTGLVYFAFMCFEAKENDAKQAAEQRKAWTTALLKEQDDKLTEIKTRYAKIEEERERDTRNAAKIAKAYETLAKSEVSAYRAKTDLKIARLEREKQLKLSLIGCNDPEKRKAVEAELENLTAESKNQ